MRKMVNQTTRTPVTHPRNPADVLLGQLMQERRKFVGFSRKGLAAQLGLTKQDIKAYEHGERHFGADTIALLRIVLKVKIGFFIDPLTPIVRKQGVARHG
ncbi:helix-turn-helix domain-containing protein [Asticcacaulis sp. ZE23SCel15]|uniref:helix-turn-helix domain-containing protein n=1 Tax=Asticcacaulis sp. ZE23SCel15 TaxID=3059027 RepID=UPI00265DAA2C|nr:helix-turn-helix domain-containing protein [Asticcacaulis sp. ZE23SCel15]WKL57645.1 helix-turn-helix domain-containing protein [Asticcacaulis sp. ZE23SCel15]